MQGSIGLAKFRLTHDLSGGQEYGLQEKNQSIFHAESTSGSSSNFQVEALRASFPALNRRSEFVFFDNAAGAQVPQIVLDAVNYHLLECNVQRGGRYEKSRAVDETILRSRKSVADLVNARDPCEIAFG